MVYPGYHCFKYLPENKQIKFLDLQVHKHENISMPPKNSFPYAKTPNVRTDDSGYSCNYFHIYQLQNYEGALSGVFLYLLLYWCFKDSCATLTKCTQWLH